VLGKSRIEGQGCTVVAAIVPQTERKSSPGLRSCVYFHSFRLVCCAASAAGLPFWLNRATRGGGVAAVAVKVIAVGTGAGSTAVAVVLAAVAAFQVAAASVAAAASQVGAVLAAAVFLAGDVAVIAVVDPAGDLTRRT
jgi:hypothetical protein